MDACSRCACFTDVDTLTRPTPQQHESDGTHVESTRNAPFQMEFVSTALLVGVDTAAMLNCCAASAGSAIEVTLGCAAEGKA